MRLITLIVLILTSTSAFAYVGPGLGLGVIGVLLGAVVAVLLAIFGVIWYPMKRMLKKKKTAESKEPESQPAKEEHKKNNGVD